MAKVNEGEKVVNIRVPAALKDLLKIAAIKEKLTLNQYIVNVLSEKFHISTKSKRRMEPKIHTEKKNQISGDFFNTDNDVWFNYFKEQWEEYKNGNIKDEEFFSDFILKLEPQHTKEAIFSRIIDLNEKLLNNGIDIFINYNGSNLFSTYEGWLNCCNCGEKLRECKCEL